MRNLTKLQAMLWPAAFALVLANCGGDSDNPDVVELTDLKAPGGLVIRDHGDGDVTLAWSTANFEKDFEGYNVYGAKIDPATANVAGLVEGEPLQLLDDKGEVREDVKTNILPLFSYSSDNEHVISDKAPAPAAELVGSEEPAGTEGAATGEETTAAAKEEKEPKISFLPIHSRKEDKPVLPTCRPDAGSCSFLTADSPEVDSDKVKSNGVITFDLPDDIKLAVGEKYCFFVFAVQDEGEEISQASTNVACITPRYKQSKTLEANPNNATTFRNKFNLTELADSCAQGTCSYTYDAYGSGIGPQTTDPRVGYEHFKGSAEKAYPYLTAGKGSAIRDVGYFEKGFEDPEFDGKVPTLEYSYGIDGNVVTNGGYSIPGQSVALTKGYVYVVAIADNADQADGSPIRYHWVWVEDITGTEIKFQFLLAKNSI